jgi:daunorubicin resistance ABC transporter membrane protein
MSTRETTLTSAGTAPARRRSTGLGGSLRAIYIVWYRDLLRFWRDRPRILVSLAQPLLFLVVFGAGLGSSLGGAFGGSGAAGSLSYAQFVYPGVIGMAVLFASVFGAMSIVWDREFGFLKEILVAPIDRSTVAIGKALGGATQALIQGLILLVLAPFVGVTLTVQSVLLLIPFVFILAFALSSMGVALASRMKSLQGFQIIMNFGHQRDGSPAPHRAGRHASGRGDRSAGPDDVRAGPADWPGGTRPARLRRGHAGRGGRELPPARLTRLEDRPLHSAARKARFGGRG